MNKVNILKIFNSITKNFTIDYISNMFERLSGDKNKAYTKSANSLKEFYLKNNILNNVDLKNIENVNLITNIYFNLKFIFQLMLPSSYGFQTIKILLEIIEELLVYEDESCEGKLLFYNDEIKTVCDNTILNIYKMNIHKDSYSLGYVCFNMTKCIKTDIAEYHLLLPSFIYLLSLPYAKELISVHDYFAMQACSEVLMTIDIADDAYFISLIANMPTPSKSDVAEYIQLIADDILELNTTV